MKFATAILATAAATVQTVEQKDLMGAEILAGFMTAYGGDFNLEALLACIGEEDKALLIANAAYDMAEDAIATKNYEEFIGVAIAMFAAYQQAMQGLPACEAVDTSSFKFEKMNNDITFATTQINLLKPSKFNFDSEFKAAISALIKLDYLKFGEIMGEVAQTMHKTTQKSESTKDIAEFLQGYLAATKVGEFNFTALLECIYVADQTAEVLDAVYHIAEEAIEDKDYMELVVGGVFVFAAYQQIETQVIPMCEQVDPSTANWTLYNSIGKSMKTDMKSILMNNMSELEQIASSVESGDFHAAGFQMGETLVAATATLY